MIEIRHKTTHAVLLRCDDDTLNGKKLTGLDLTAANLSGTSLCYTCLRRATLHLADLSGAVLCNAVMDNANLMRANLAKADLTSASMLGTQLRSANLAGATLRYTQLTGADLQGANLEGADLSMADLRANFRDAILIRADLRGANLAGANLRSCDLTAADLTSANLQGAVLTGARLQGAKLDRGVEASVRAVTSAAAMFSRHVEPRPVKAPLTIDFESVGRATPTRKPDGRADSIPKPREARQSASGKASPAANGSHHSTSSPNKPTRLTPGGESGDRFVKWRNFLRVRYRGSRQHSGPPVKVGAEGVVLEFFGPLGNAYWQVQFAEAGNVFVHRQDLDVLDAEFFDDDRREEESEVEELLKEVKETVVYSTSSGKFKSLVVWYAGNRYVTVDEIRKAETLIRLCKQRRIRMTRDRWFD